MLLVLLAALALFWMESIATTGPAKQVMLASYATSLLGRTGSQRHNAARAADRLDGVIVPPGGVFSFNGRVNSWSQDAGYVKAPVSYDGDLVRAFGGGVCQTSTTLYNAALLGGLKIFERHHHTFSPHYIAPGRDAAVAQPNIDLRFQNPYPWPITIRVEAVAHRLVASIYGEGRPADRVSIQTIMLEQTRPQRLARVVHVSSDLGPRPYVRNPGAVGYRVVTLRVFRRNGRVVRHERLSDDTYQAMDRLVQVVELK